MSTSKPWEPVMPKGLTRENQKKFKAMDSSRQSIYGMGNCQSCNVKLTKERINKCIAEETLLMCAKDWARAQAQMQKLAPLFGQLKLL